MRNSIAFLMSKVQYYIDLTPENQRKIKHEIQPYRKSSLSEIIDEVVLKVDPETIQIPKKKTQKVYIHQTSIDKLKVLKKINERNYSDILNYLLDHTTLEKEGVHYELRLDSKIIRPLRG